MMSAEQHVRDAHPLKLGRLGVLRMLQQTVGKRIIRVGLFQDDTILQADDRVADDHRGRLSAGQHIIADADLFIRKGADALIKAFIVHKKIRCSLADSLRACC